MKSCVFFGGICCSGSSVSLDFWGVCLSCLFRSAVFVQLSTARC